MSTQHQLGDTIERDGLKWRVIRITSQDHSLFEDENGAYVVTEAFIQLKSENGQVDFIVLSSERTEYKGVPSTIKALEPIIWRRQ